MTIHTIMKFQRLFYSFLVFLLLFSSCNSTNTIVQTHKKPTQPLNKSLVYAIAQKYETRMMWEKELAYRLSIKGYDVITSVSIDESHKKPYTLEELRSILKDNNIDGVITLKFLDLKKKTGYSGADRYISETSGAYYMFNYLNPNMNVYQWTYQIEETVTIESNLYEAKSEEILFHAETSMTNADSNEALAGEITESLSRSINNSKILKKTKE